MLVFTPNLVPRCALYPFLSVPNFKVMGLRVQVLWQFFQVCEKKKKMKKMSKFLSPNRVFEDSYLRNGWHDFLLIWFENGCN